MACTRSRLSCLACGLIAPSRSRASERTKILWMVAPSCHPPLVPPPHPLVAMRVTSLAAATVLGALCAATQVAAADKTDDGQKSQRSSSSSSRQAQPRVACISRSAAHVGACWCAGVCFCCAFRFPHRGLPDDAAVHRAGLPRQRHLPRTHARRGRRARQRVGARTAVHHHVPRRVAAGSDQSVDTHSGSGVASRQNGNSLGVASCSSSAFCLSRVLFSALCPFQCCSAPAPRTA